jgi:hypothetical protein
VLQLGVSKTAFLELCSFSLQLSKQSFEDCRLKKASSSSSSTTPNNPFRSIFSPEGYADVITDANLYEENNMLGRVVGSNIMANFECLLNPKPNPKQPKKPTGNVNHLRQNYKPSYENGKRVWVYQANEADAITGKRRRRKNNGAKEFVEWTGFEWASRLVVHDEIKNDPNKKKMWDAKNSVHYHKPEYFSIHIGYSTMDMTKADAICYWMNEHPRQWSLAECAQWFDVKCSKRQGSPQRKTVYSETNKIKTKEEE